MAIFSKKVTGEEWKQAVSPFLPEISSLCDLFVATGKAVESDLITGWANESDKMAKLPSHEEVFKRIKAAFDKAGNPASTDVLVIGSKRHFDDFFSLGKWAFHWGKYHYADASGGPGQRALNETGMAQRAAGVRIMNNGRQFAENALRAAEAGRNGVHMLTAEKYDIGGPSLSALFLWLIPEEARVRIAAQQKVRFSEMAMIGAWLFNHSAIFGMVVSAEPEEFVRLMWDPSRIEKYWEFVNPELARIDALEDEPKGLGFLRLNTGYAELFGAEATAAALADGNFNRLNKLAATMVPVSKAENRWMKDVLVGFGLGLVRPALVATSLEAEATPDIDSWRESYEAGLDIPEQPEALEPEEQIDAVIQSFLALLEEYHPAAHTKLLGIEKR